jgi:protein-tyrosine phosphatase
LRCTRRRAHFVRCHARGGVGRVGALAALLGTVRDMTAEELERVRKYRRERP